MAKLQQVIDLLVKAQFDKRDKEVLKGEIKDAFNQSVELDEESLRNIVSALNRVLGSVGKELNIDELIKMPSVDAWKKLGEVAGTTFVDAFNSSLQGIDDKSMQAVIEILQDIRNNQGVKVELFNKENLDAAMQSINNISAAVDKLVSNAHGKYYKTTEEINEALERSKNKIKDIEDALNYKSPVKAKYGGFEKVIDIYNEYMSKKGNSPWEEEYAALTKFMTAFSAFESKRKKDPDWIRNLEKENMWAKYKPMAELYKSRIGGEKERRSMLTDVINANNGINRASEPWAQEHTLIEVRDLLKNGLTVKETKKPTKEVVESQPKEGVKSQPKENSKPQVSPTKKVAEDELMTLIRQLAGATKEGNNTQIENIDKEIINRYSEPIQKFIKNLLEDFDIGENDKQLNSAMSDLYKKLQSYDTVDAAANKKAFEINKENLTTLFKTLYRLNSFVENSKKNGVPEKKYSLSNSYVQKLTDFIANEDLIDQKKIDDIYNLIDELYDAPKENVKSIVEKLVNKTLEAIIAPQTSAKSETLIENKTPINKEIILDENLTAKLNALTDAISSLAQNELNTLIDIIKSFQVKEDDSNNDINKLIQALISNQSDNERGAFLNSKSGKYIGFIEGDQDSVSASMDDYKQAAKQGYDTRIHSHTFLTAAPSVTGKANDIQNWINTFDYIKKHIIATQKELLSVDLSGLRKKQVEEIKEAYLAKAEPLMEAAPNNETLQLQLRQAFESVLKEKGLSNIMTSYKLNDVIADNFTKQSNGDIQSTINASIDPTSLKEAISDLAKDSTIVDAKDKIISAITNNVKPVDDPKILREIKQETGNQGQRFQRIQDIASDYEDVDDVEAAIKQFGEIYKQIVLMSDDGYKYIKPDKTGINILRKIASGDFDVSDYSGIEFQRVDRPISTTKNISINTSEITDAIRDNAVDTKDLAKEETLGNIGKDLKTIIDNTKQKDAPSNDIDLDKKSNVNNPYLLTDTNGKAVVVYRGLRDSFAGLVSNRTGNFGTDNLDVAKGYTHGDGKVLAYNVEMHNPLEIDGKNKFLKKIVYFGNAFENVTNPVVIELKGLLRTINKLQKEAETASGYEKNVAIPQKIEKLQARINEISEDESHPYGVGGTDLFVRKAKKNGYDGVIFRDLVDPSSTATEAQRRPSNIIVTFDEKQMHLLETLSISGNENTIKTNELAQDSNGENSTTINGTINVVSPSEANQIAQESTLKNIFDVLKQKNDSISEKEISQNENKPDETPIETKPVESLDIKKEKVDIEKVLQEITALTKKELITRNIRGTMDDVGLNQDSVYYGNSDIDNIIQKLEYSKSYLKKFDDPSTKKLISNFDDIIGLVASFQKDRDILKNKYNNNEISIDELDHNNDLVHFAGVFNDSVSDLMTNLPSPYDFQDRIKEILSDFTSEDYAEMAKIVETAFDASVQKVAKIREELSAAKNELEDIQKISETYGYTSTMSAREAGRINSTLEKPVNKNVPNYSRNKYVIKMLKDGSLPQKYSDGYGFSNNDGSYYKITKTEYDYAVYLQETIAKLNVGFDEGLQILKSQNGQLEAAIKKVNELEIAEKAAVQEQDAAYERQAIVHNNLAHIESNKEESEARKENIEVTKKIETTVVNEAAAHRENADAIAAENNAIEKNILLLKEKAKQMSLSEWQESNQRGSELFAAKYDLYQAGHKEVITDDFWRQTQYEKPVNYTPISLEKASEILYDKISQNIYDGWYRNADSEYKPKIEASILGDDEIRNASLNNMWHAYEDFIGKSIDFFEFLNTEIPVYRGKNSENFTEDDTFISFSFDENIAKKFGDTVIQTLIKPIETLGNLSRSGEYEVMVPRESIAAYDNIPNGVKIDYSNPNDENAQQILAVTNARKEEAEAHRENEAAIIGENEARRERQAIEAEVKAADARRTELVKRLDEYGGDILDSATVDANIKEREKIYKALEKEGLLTDELKNKYEEVNRRLKTRVYWLEQAESYYDDMSDVLGGDTRVTDIDSGEEYRKDYVEPFSTVINEMKDSGVFSEEEIENTFSKILEDMRSYADEMDADNAFDQLNEKIINPEDINDITELNRLLQERKNIIENVYNGAFALKSRDEEAYAEVIKLNKAIEDRIALLQQLHSDTTGETEVVINQKKIESYEDLLAIVQQEKRTDTQDLTKDSSSNGPWALENTLNGDIKNTLENIQKNTTVDENNKIETTLGEDAISKITNTLSKINITSNLTTEGLATQETVSGIADNVKSINDKITQNGLINYQENNTDVGNVLATESTLKKILDVVQKTSNGKKQSKSSNKNNSSTKTNSDYKKSTKEDYRGSNWFPDKLKSRIGDLAKFRAQLMTTGKLTDEIDAQIYELVNAMNQVKSGPDLSIWNEKFHQLRTKVGIDKIFDDASDKEDIKIYKELIALKQLEYSIEKKYVKAKDGSVEKQYYENQLTTLRQVITSQNIIKTNDEYELKLAKMKEDHERELGAIKAQQTDADNKEEIKSVENLIDLYKKLGKTIAQRNHVATQEARDAWQQVINAQVTGIRNNPYNTSENRGQFIAAVNEGRNTKDLSLSVQDAKKQGNARAQQEKIDAAQREAEVVRQLVELYKQLGEAQARQNTSLFSQEEADAAKLEAERLRQEIKAKRFDSIDYATDMKFKAAKQSGFDATTTKATAEKENNALKEQETIIKRIVDLHKELGNYQAQAENLDGQEADFWQAKADEIKEKIIEEKQLLTAFANLNFDQLSQQFEETRKKSKYKKEDSIFLKSLNLEDKTQQNDIKKLLKNYEKLGKLQASFDQTGNLKTQEEIKQLQQIIDSEQQRLGLTQQQITALESRKNVIYKENQELLQAQEREKARKATLKQQLKDAQAEANKNKANSVLSAGREAISNIGATIDINKISVDTTAKIGQLSKELETLNGLYKSVRDAQNPSDVEKYSQALIDQTAKVKKLTAEVNGLTNEYSELQGDNIKEIGINTLGDKANISDYEDQLTKAVRAAYGAKATITGFDADTKRLSFTIKKGAHEFVNYEAAIRNGDNALVSIQGTTKRTETLLQAITRKTKEIFTYFSGSSIIYKAINEVQKGIQYVRDIDTALTELKKVTDETEESYDKFLKTAAKTADKVGSTIKEVVSSTADWARLGYSMEEAANLAESTSVLLNVSEFSSIDDATSALISTMQAFGYAAKDSMHVVDVMNEIGNNYAVSSDGIATALQDSASSLMAANNSYQEAVALIASANKVVQDPNSVGAALRTISLRLRGTSTKELEEAGEDTEGTITSKSKLRSKIKTLSGVDILTDTGAYKSTYQILLEISKVWEKMSDIDQAALLEIIAGKTRSNTAAAILSNTTDLENAYVDALHAEGSAYKENEKYMNSIQGKIDLFNNAVQTLWNNTLDDAWIKGFVDFGTEIVKLIDNVGMLTTALIALTAVKLVPWLLKGITSVETFGGALKTILASLTYITGTKQTLASFFAQTAAGAMNAAGGVATFGTYLKAAGATLKAFFTTPLGWFTIAATVIGIVVTVVDQLNTSFDEQVEKLNKAREEYEESQNTLEDLNNELETTKNRIKELQNLGTLTVTEKEELNQLKEYNSELERRIKLSERAKASEQRELAKEAVETYNKLPTTKESNTGKDPYKNYFDNFTPGYLDADAWNNFLNSYGEIEGASLSYLNILYDKLLNVKDEYIQSIEDDNLKLKFLEPGTPEDVLNRLSNSDKQAILSEWDATEVQDSISGLNDVLEDIKSEAFKLISDNESGYQALLDDMSPRYEQIIATNQNLWSDSDKKIVETYNAIEEKIKSIWMKYDPSEWIKLSSEEIWSDASFSDIYKKLPDLVQDGILNEEELRKNFDDSIIDALIAACKDKGILLSDLLNDAVIEATRDAENEDVNESKITDTLTSITSLEDAFNSLGDAIKEFKEDGIASASTLKSLKETFSDVDGFEELYTVLATGEGDVEEAITNVANAYIAQKGSLSDLTDEELQIMAARLESLGVVHAKEILLNRQRLQQQLDDDLQGYNIDLSAYSTVEEAKAAITDVATNNICSAVANMEAELQEQYGINLSDFVSTEEEKVTAAKEAAKKIAEANKEAALSDLNKNTELTERQYREQKAKIEYDYENTINSINSIQNVPKKVAEILDSYYSETFEFDFSGNKIGIGRDFDEQFSTKASELLSKIQKKYENKIALLEAQQTYLENEIKKAEAENRQVGKAVYDEQIRLEQQKISLYEQELAELQKQMGSVAEGSDEWNEFADAIWDVKHNIQESTIAIVDFKQKIVDLYVDAFGKIEDAFENQQKLYEYQQDYIRNNIEYFKQLQKIADDAEMLSLQQGGTVDLFNRPQINGSKLAAAGWEDVDSDEIATVYSSTYSNEDGTLAINFTPILPNGDVLSPDELTRYAEEVIAGVRPDDLQLQIGGAFNGEDAIDQAVNAAERIHELQENFYLNIGSDLEPASAQSYKNLIEIQKRAYESAQQEAASFNETLARGMADGSIEEGSEEWANLTLQIFGAVTAAQQARNEIENINNELKQLYVDSFDKVIEAFDNLDDLHSDRQAYIEDYINYMELIGEPIPTSAYDYMILEENQKLSDNLEELSSLRDKLADSIENGGIEVGSTEWTDMESKIRDCEKAIQDNRIALAQYNKELQDLYVQAFDKVKSAFGNENDLYSDQQSFIDSYIDYLETLDIKVPAELYEKQIAIEEEKQQRNIKQLAELQSALADMEAQGITPEDDAWVQAHADIRECEAAIWDSEKAMAEFNKTMRELDSQVFDEIIKRIDDITDELSNVYDLISDEDVTTEDGSWTEEGITSLGLMIQKMEIAKAKSKEYQKKIEDLNEEYKSGTISEQEYNDRLVELKNSQWNAIDAYEDAKDAIIDINEARIDLIEDGIQKEIDSYEELIDLKKKELDAEKDLYTFRKDIQKQTKDIAALERKIAAMAGSSDAATVAERTKLQAQLREAQESLDDTYYNHAMDSQSQALDDESEAFSKAGEDYVKDLRESLKDVEQIVADTLAQVFINADTVLGELNTISDEHGITLSDALTEPWNYASLKAEEFKNNAIGTENEFLIQNGIFTGEVTTQLDEMFGAGSESAQSFHIAVTGVIDDIKNKVTTDESTIQGQLVMPYEEAKKYVEDTFSEDVKKKLQEVANKAESLVVDETTDIKTPFEKGTESANTFGKTAQEVLEAVADKTAEVSPTLTDDLTTPPNDGSEAYGLFDENVATVFSNMVTNASNAATKISTSMTNIVKDAQKAVSAINSVGGDSTGGGGGKTVESPKEETPPKTYGATVTASFDYDRRTTLKDTATVNGYATQAAAANAAKEKARASVGEQWIQKRIKAGDTRSEASRSWNNNKYKNVMFSGLSYHAKGTLGTTKDEWAITDEPQYGDELVLIPNKEGNLSYMRKGTSVVPADITENLMKWGQFAPNMEMSDVVQGINLMSNYVSKPILNLSFDALVKAEKITEDTLPTLKKFVTEELDKFSRNLNYSLRRVGAK